MKTVSSINVEEVKKFEQLANEWWNTEGKFKPLHMLNPCRLEFITDHLSMHFKKDLTIVIIQNISRSKRIIKFSNKSNQYN